MLAQSAGKAHSRHIAATMDGDVATDGPYGWPEPRLPDNWHGVWSTPEKPGSRVVVHE